MKPIEELAERVAALNDVLCAASLLNWDTRTMMPPGGAETRGRQIATLKGIARGMLLSDDMLKARDAALAAVDRLPGDALERRAVNAIAAAIAHHRRIPAGLLAEQAALGPVVGAAWAEARARSDFSIFLPYLRKTVDIAWRTADAIGYDQHPYDAMVAIFEPGESSASLSRFFGALRAGIAPILAEALSRPPPRRDFLFRHFPEQGQRALALELADALGYDLGRGRLDRAVHPFEISFTRNDVRITTRYNEHYLPAAIFGTIHEVGHGLYEQGVSENLTRTVFATDLIGLYAVGGTSFGAHESQSRLWENHIGRSGAFWNMHFDKVSRHFPGTLDDVDAVEFTAAINHVEPGFIRVEADELTYDLHIMLRVEIEMALMDGSLDPADVPAAWNEAVRRDLGLAVPDDARGCLQDVHWSSGYIGSFPTYTIGNAMAAQLMEALRVADPGLGRDTGSGNYGKLAERLRADVWMHGRSKTRDELLRDVTGALLSFDPYLRYLQQKFATGAVWIGR